MIQDQFWINGAAGSKNTMHHDCLEIFGLYVKYKCFFPCFFCFLFFSGGGASQCLRIIIFKCLYGQTIHINTE